MLAANDSMDNPLFNHALGEHEIEGGGTNGADIKMLVPAASF